MISSEKKERRTLAILYVLAAYIALQVWWWGYSLVQIHKQVAFMRQDLTALQQEQLFNLKVWMIVGEGGVFLIMLLLGFWYIKRTISRELQLARMEKTFLLSVTHELKTPIAAIRLFLETIKARKLTEEQTKAILNDALRETERLQMLSENILLATRFDKGRGELMNEQVHLSDMLTQITHRVQATNKVHFQLELEEDVIMRGDRELLRAMCSNLIENAIKYSAETPEVFIHLSTQDKNIILKIADSGIGIPDDEKQKVFDKFYRSGNEQTRQHKGTGLGLYIASSVVRLHHGSISVANNSPKGSVFEVVFLKHY
jgi:signal transduction histidine kinase